MTYEWVRKNAKTGDLFLVEGDKFFSKLIEIFTGESFSHVAGLFWQNDGLWVAEFVEGTGYQLLPASQWITKQSGPVYYGMAPDPVRADPTLGLNYIFSFRSKDSKEYGYLSLFKVWLSQLTGKVYRVRHLVCSTFIQKWWEQYQVKMRENLTPGDYLNLCQYTSKLTG